MLTNGRQWYIYKAHLPKPLTEKRVFVVEDIFTVAAVEAMALLSRQSMLNRGLMEAWSARRVSRPMQEQVETPNSPVRKILRKIASQETGQALSDSQIGSILTGLLIKSGKDSCRSAETDSATSAMQIASNPLPSHSTENTLYTLEQLSRDPSPATGRKPAALYFADQECIPVNSWVDVMQFTIKKVGTSYGLPPLPFQGRRGNKFFLNTHPFHANGKPMTGCANVQINDNALYVDIGRSAMESARALLNFLHAVCAPSDIIKVSIR